jgi:hypothetical protein
VPEHVLACPERPGALEITFHFCAVSLPQTTYLSIQLNVTLTQADPDWLVLVRQVALHILHCPPASGVNEWGVRNPTRPEQHLHTPCRRLTGRHNFCSYVKCPHSQPANFFSFPSLYSPVRACLVTFGMDFITTTRSCLLKCPTSLSIPPNVS